MIEQYLLLSNGYYWIWYRDWEGKSNLNGPHSEKIINLPVIECKNPLDFKPINEDKINDTVLD